MSPCPDVTTTSQKELLKAASVRDAIMSWETQQVRPDAPRLPAPNQPHP